MTNAMSIRHGGYFVKIKMYRPWWLLGVMVRYVYSVRTSVGITVDGEGFSFFTDWALDDVEHELRRIGDLK